MKSYVPPENPTKPWPTEAPMERWFLHPGREPTGSKVASRRGSKPAVHLARGPSLAWRQTPDRKIPGEQESSLLRSSPMEMAIQRIIEESGEG